ncbi:MAG: single-stranded DNA-binding protein [Paludibacteraceae bacterium]|nr:single-stranded DNA-binding protein [Paludibacteraceae bacterium]
MSVNKVILIGNVGKEPDVRYLENDVRVANFPLATTERGYTMSNGTQVPDRTEWHSIVVWRNLAEIAEKYIHKSTKLYVEGKLKTRIYDDKTGVRRYITEIYADNIQILSPVQQQQYQQPAQQQYQQPVQQQQVQQPAQPETPARTEQTEPENNDFPQTF